MLVRSPSAAVVKMQNVELVHIPANQTGSPSFRVIIRDEQHESKYKKLLNGIRA